MSWNNPEELCEEFFLLEEDLELLDKKICNTYFWERVRVPINQHLRDSEFLDNEDNENSGYREYISGTRLLVRNLFVRNPFFSQRTDLLFYGTGRRKKLDDNLWWDIYHDPVIESVNEECVLWERPYNVSHLAPAKTSNLRYVDMVEYAGTLLHKLGISTVSFSDEEHSLINGVEEEIESRFGVEVPLKSLVREDLSKRKTRLPLYRKLIRRVNPSISFLTTSYNGRETFVEACQSEDVPVAELQHGSIHRYHMAYSFPYDEKNAFPDYFFAFGDFWSDSVELPLPEENVYSVGYPYMESKLNQYEDIEQKEQVIFISQLDIGEELSRFAVELSETEGHDADIIYKLHPKEYDSWEQDYPWLSESDIVCVTEETPLYKLFAESTAQIGVYSSALYEGLRFGLQTYILELPGGKSMQSLIENDYAESIRTVNEYINCRNEDKEMNTMSDVRYFFNDNPIDRFESAIKDIRQSDGRI